MRQRPSPGTGPRTATLFFCLGLAVASLAAEPRDATREAWSLVTTLRFEEAADAFARIEGHAGADAGLRAARLGQATAALQAQPRTESGVRAALTELDRLAAEPPADDVALAAAFLAARVVQDHLSPADPRDAARRFRDLHERHGAHPLGQIAWVRWALLSLYDGRDPADTTTPDEQLARIEREGASLTHPLALRDFHLLLAYAYPDLAPSDDAMLRHLLAAEATGLLRWQTRRDLYVQIVETALALGESDVARRYFGRYEAAYPRDQRRQLLSERIAALLENDR